MSTDQEGSSTIFQSIVSSVIFFGTIALVVLLVISKKKPKKQEDARQAPAVEFVKVQPYDGDIKINVTGVTMPFREITIAAEVTGAVTEKTGDCQAGRFVKEDVHLLSIDSEKYQLALSRLASEITEAGARLEKIEAELKAAKEIQKATKEDYDNESDEWQKRDSLFKANAISETEWNQSRRTFNAAKNAKTTQDSRVATLMADVKAQNSLVELKRVQKKEAQIDFDNAVIKAPTKGVVISDDVEKNDFVQVGQKLLVFEDTSAVEVKCDLRADQLQAVLESRVPSTKPEDQFKLPPLEAKIRYEANDQTFVWTGVLDRFDGLGLDDITRTAPCRILVKNTLSELPDPESDPDNLTNRPRRTLVRGMYVSVELNLKQRPNLLAIPAESLRAGNYVWVYIPTIDETGGRTGFGRLSKRPVKVVNRVVEAETQKEFVIAKASSESIRQGEFLITSPIPQPIDGMVLREFSGTSSDEDVGSSEKSKVSQADGKKSVEQSRSDSNQPANQQVATKQDTMKQDAMKQVAMKQDTMKQVAMKSLFNEKQEAVR